jgi:aminoglycoside phosphotransferase (APT) family kinase protein
VSVPFALVPDWDAEVTVDEALAWRLVREQFAPLPERSLALLSRGWDYSVLLVDDAWTFRFPRRTAVVPGTEREIAVLGALAPLLPVGLPAPTHVGAPSEGFPWPFYGAPYLQGSEVAEAGLDDERRAALARPLARALRALHGPAALAAVGALLPVDPIGRADMSTRVPRTRTALAEVEALGLWRPTPAVEESLEAALALPPAEPAAVCHGDLHFRQLLVADGGLTAILDWVDVCRADPGIDLQLYWSFVPADLRDAFLHEYGPVTEASLLRARVLALFLNATLARYGHAEGLAAVEAEAVAALVRTMAYG